ncbi:zinc finger protein VAR3, chloroplastic-like [Silene latifolia]|uniref:zinc finger protein VAR3, chloroplastic-like n=1 Tax=Silene latifolia TaxID=37657 RepID=UPI003D775A3E
MFLRTRTTDTLFHFTLKPSIPKTLIFSRTCTATATVSPQVPSSSQHPWPEWVSFVDRLKSHGYFPNSSPGDDGGNGDSELVYHDLKLLKNPCISFARDHFDIFKSLSKDDIENVVEIGCPKLDRRVCNSAKRLREYVGLVEKKV